MHETRTLVVAGGLLVILLVLVGVFVFTGRQEGGGQEEATTKTPVAGGEEAPTQETPEGKEESVEAEQGAGETREEIVLKIITRHPGEILLAAKEEFLSSEIAKKYNVVDIKFYSVPPVSWVSAINKRGDIDIAWGGGPTLFDLLFSEGLLAPLNSSEALDAAAQIPDTFAGAPLKRIGDDGNIYWVAASIASFGFTVNHDVLQQYNLPVPRKWIDLSSPVYAEPLVHENRPVIAIADPTRSTSNTRMYEIILQAYGWEQGWIVLTGMAANALVEGGSADVRDDVITGRGAIGITIDFYGYTAMLANPKTEYIIPEGETIINGDPIALLVTSKNKEAAQAFIAWVLTEGQKIWFREDINRLPANPNAFNLPEGAKREDLKQVYEKLRTSKSMEFDDQLALSVEQAMQLYFKATLVDLNQLLKEVWRDMARLYFEGVITEDEFRRYFTMLGEPLTYVDPVTGENVAFTLEDAMRVTEILKKDPALKDKYVHAWREAAIERYNSLLEELSRLGS